MNRETKQESSVPIQSRVSIIHLAELDKYWKSEGYDIKTMSQLINWSMDLLSQILRNNGKVEEVKGVAEAHLHLSNRGLYQNVTKRRGFDKIGRAISFENSRREEGLIDDRHYNMLHRKTDKHGNSSSVQPFNEKVLHPDTVRALEIMKKLEEEGIPEDKRIFTATNNFDVVESSTLKEGMSEDELARHIQEKDKREKEAMDDFLKSLKKKYGE